eukprot:GHVP01048172.1.p1 GENE.GHVP01048172.1~~GHVP01048172.1.p1  ORF type:complete len:523 (+),score=58.70 GHVP01048172.1:154-1722(+)
MSLKWPDRRVLAIVATLSIQFGYSLSMLNIPFPYYTLLGGWCEATPNSSSTTVLPTVCPEGKYILSLCHGSLMGGAAIGSLFAAPALKKGRIFLIRVCHILQALSCLTFVSLIPKAFVTGRLLQGIAVGASSVVAPLYISEISAPEKQSSRVAIHQLLLTFGIVVGIIIPFSLPDLPPYSDQSFLSMQQRTQVYFCLCVPGILGLVGFVLHTCFFTEETPSFLLQESSRSEAIWVYRKIVGNHSRDEDLNISFENQSESETFKKVWTSPSFLRILAVAVGLSAGQQISGINAFISMSNWIFREAGVSPDKINLCSLGVAASNFIVTVPAIFLVDSIGKKPLIMGGLLTQTMALTVTACSTFVPFLAGSFPFLSSFSLCLFVVAFSIGYGPVLWIHLPEIFPPRYQKAGMATAVFANWISSMIVLVGSTYVSVKNSFRIFSVLCALSYLFVWRFMLETKNTKRTMNESKSINMYMEIYGKPTDVRMTEEKEANNLLPDTTNQENLTLLTRMGTWKESEAECVA